MNLLEYVTRMQAICGDTVRTTLRTEDNKLVIEVRFFRGTTTIKQEVSAEYFNSEIQPNTLQFALLQQLLDGVSEYVHRMDKEKACAQATR